MITAIEIENFKGIGERQRIELKPITLLFGPNSAGKSTILHALHYAREILERHNVDADRTIGGGDFVDLGGFAKFVHRHRLDVPLSLRFELDLSKRHLPEYVEEFMTPFHFDTYAKSAAVSIEVRWSHVERRPFVALYSVEINGQTLAALRKQAGRKSVEVEINADHPAFREPHEKLSPDAPGDGDGTPILEMVGEGPLFAGGQVDALPPIGKIIEFEGPTSEEATDDGPVVFDTLKQGDLVRPALTQLIGGPAHLLRDALQTMRYVGPLRATPPRSYVPLRHEDPGRWASGLAAWDRLHFAYADVLEEVSQWLSAPDRLATGYLLRRADMLEIDSADPAIVQLRSEYPFDEAELSEIRERLKNVPTRRYLALVDKDNGIELAPQDVGEGIAQIVPVAVALIDEADALTAIEQPELHVHPAVQVGLGDLLIYATQWRSLPMLIETHSEHLLLRILRRIRETKEGQEIEEDLKVTPDQVSVVYMEQDEAGIRAQSLRIDESGEFIDRWPRGFFEERARELF